MNQVVQELLDTVVKNDFCIGCGICASIIGSPLEMELDENGKYKPVIKGSVDEKTTNILSVCPFAEKSDQETKLGKEQFGTNSIIKYDEHSGYYISTYAGFVKEGNYREKGSSGGIGSWIAAQLLQEKLVDGIIHVKPSKKMKFYLNIKFLKQLKNFQWVQNLNTIR